MRVEGRWGLLLQCHMPCLGTACPERGQGASILVRPLALALLVLRVVLSEVPWGYRQILNTQQSNPNRLLQIHACSKGMETWDVLFWM